jgi:hypothetical protein
MVGAAAARPVGAPASGEGYPFIGSNPTVPLPTGVTDTAIVRPLADTGGHADDGNRRPRGRERWGRESWSWWCGWIKREIMYRAHFGSHRSVKMYFLKDVTVKVNSTYYETMYTVG